MYFTKALFATCVCLAHVGVSNAVQFTQWPSTLYPGEAATVNWEGALDVVNPASFWILTLVSPVC